MSEDLSLTYNFPYQSYTNFAFSYVTGTYTSSGQVFTLATPSETGLFPVNLPFKLTYFNVTDYPSVYDDPAVEILNVTGLFASGFFVTRAQEGTVSSGSIAGKNYAVIQSPVSSDYENKWKYFANPDNTVYYFDDFDWGIVSSTVLGWTNNGTAQILSTLSNQKRLGVVSVNTAATSSSILFRLNNQLFRTDSGPITFNCGWNPRFGSLDSNILPCELRWGLGDVTNSGSLPNNGLYFHYITNSGTGLYIVSAVNSIYNYTLIETGRTIITTTTTPYRNYKIILENSNSARFYTNNIEVSGSPITTNIPWGSGQEIGPFFQATTLANNNIRFDLDYFECYQDLTGQRTTPLLMTDLISYWPLYETGGTAFDNFSTINLTQNNNPLGTSGILISGRRFNGSNQNLETTNISFLNLSGSGVGFSTFGWFNASNTGGTQSLVSIWGGLLGKQFHVSLSNGNVIFEGSTDGTNAATSTNSTIIQKSGWNFFCGYYDNIRNMIGIRVNNSYAPETSFNGFYATPTLVDFSIGADDNIGSPTNFFNGTLSEVGIVQRPLTTGEMNFLYNNSGGTLFPFNYYNEQ